MGEYYSSINLRELGRVVPDFGPYRREFVRSLHQDHQTLIAQHPDREDAIVHELRWRALKEQRFGGKYALIQATSRGDLLHGTPVDIRSTGGIIHVNQPYRIDEQNRKYPVGVSGIWASKGDVETPVRKALLNPKHPVFVGQEEIFPLFYRRVDNKGRSWLFTSRKAINRLKDTDARGYVGWWKERGLPAYTDPFTGEILENERLIKHAVKVPDNQWAEVGVEDLMLSDPDSMHPERDLYVIEDADRAKSFAYLDSIINSDNFITLADDMGIAVTPLSSDLYPGFLNPFVTNLQAQQQRKVGA
jgi:hypothetical protein